MTIGTKMAEDARRGLGRGLSALIGDEQAQSRSEKPVRGARTVPIAFLKPNRFQPRKDFDPAELQDLAHSIAEKGMLQPILVRTRAGEANSFEIVAGERRWRAAQMAKLHDVPVVVRDMSDGEALELAIVENVQRADLNAIEEAAAYQELIDRFQYTQDRLAQEVGKSRSHIANSVRLLKLPEAVRAMIREGKLTAGHARTLIGMADPEARARELIVAGATVRQAEQRSKPPVRSKGPATDKDADTKALESSLSNVLGLSVHILHKGENGGELRIHYKSLEQLDDLIRRLNRAP